MSNKIIHIKELPGRRFELVYNQPCSRCVFNPAGPGTLMQIERDKGCANASCLTTSANVREVGVSFK